ncbi:MAG TPA: acyl carrier protein [Thermotogota bacterium]|nr:acyl carrier protein [Thermotogota bacterium]HPJ88277.1 acyl carrier protein [Thermotogota bacterium]HPR95376.1 acyl carrier protein [Thermotogota bacterium]
MEKQLEFLEKLADIMECETDDLTLDTNFREDIDDWDSLKGFSMLILFEEDYDRKMSVEEFLGCRQIRDLFHAVCE